MVTVYYNIYNTIHIIQPINICFVIKECLDLLSEERFDHRNDLILKICLLRPKAALKLYIAYYTRWKKYTH